jgi:putative NADH-flavin reductase
MESQNVCRLIVVSAGGAGDSFKQLALIVKVLVKTVLRNTYADHEQQERYVRDSHLEWVIIRPSMLIDGPATGRYHTGSADARLPGGKVTRADVADFALKQLTENCHLRQAVSIS